MLRLEFSSNLAEWSYDPADHSTWVRLDNLKLDPDLFAIHVAGRSMEPKIPDGSICIFRGGEALVGTRCFK